MQSHKERPEQGAWHGESLNTRHPRGHQVPLCLRVETAEGVQRTLGLRGLATINWAWKATDKKKP